VDDSISKPSKSCLGQGVRSLRLLMLGEGKFLPPKLPLLLQHAASASLKPAASLCTSYGIFSCIVYGKLSVSVKATLDDLVLVLTDLLLTNWPSRPTYRCSGDSICLTDLKSWLYLWVVLHGFHLLIASCTLLH
jgi:hypothetical protein